MSPHSTTADISAASAIAGCHWGVGCEYAAVNNPFLQACTVFVPLAAVAEALACVALMLDRMNGQQKFYNRAVTFGMIISMIAFGAAAIQWIISHDSYSPTLAARTGKGVIILGHAAWGAILAFLAGAPSEFMVLDVSHDEILSPIISVTLDEKPYVLTPIATVRLEV